MATGQLWVFVEQRRGVWHEVSLELLGKARELADAAGGEVAAVVLGANVAGEAARLTAYGADLVLVADHPELELYRLLPYTQVLAQACEAHRPEVFLFGATALGMELAPRLAARLGTGLSAHCIDLMWDEQGELLQVVPGWGGGVAATIRCPRQRPVMATVMPGVFKKPAPSPQKGRVAALALPENLDLAGPEVLQITHTPPQERPLEEAEVVVAGGFGMGGMAGWRQLEELARRLQGAVGATRPAVDEGWAREEQMIGQSGKTVRPRLYIGVGISGVSHHVVGMQDAEFIVAINKDPKAPIFAVADVAVVGDWRDILPALLNILKAKT